MSVRTARVSGKHWRPRAYALLRARDGERCQQCGCAKRTVWRNAGYGTGELWGTDPWETARFSIVRPTSNLEVDHRTPLSEGGTNDLDNLHLLCMGCHKRKTSGERSARLKRLFAEARA